MTNEPDIWQKYAEKRRRQEELKRLDEWLGRLHNERPFLSLLLTTAISMLLFGLAMGLKAAIEWIGELCSR